MEQRSFGLDLLRSVAIALVLFAHLTPSLVELLGFPGHYPSTLVSTTGFVGVEMFFVLSGFLIGTILLRALQADMSWNGWLVFMVRRWARTLPLYLIWIALVAACFPPSHHPVQHVLTYLAFLQNFARPMPADNWFGVSWSLAVEEWFYLLFSALLFAVWRWTPRHAFKIVCTAFIVLPVLGRFSVGAGNWDAVARKVVLLRLDAIAYGVIFAYAWARFRPQIHQARIPAFLLGTLLLSVLLAQGDTFARWPITSLLMFNMASVGTVLCLPALTALKPGAEMWAAPVRWISARSYALYLMHLTILELALRVLQSHTRPQGFAIAALIVAGLAIGSECSFRYVEQPVLRRRPKPGSRILPSSRSALGVPSRNVTQGGGGLRRHDQASWVRPTS